MRVGSRHRVFWASVAVMVCLLGAVSARGQAGSEAPLLTENLFKNIQVLKGIPIDTFFDAMGMFAASMGDDCTFCHSKEAVFRHAAFAEPTPMIQRARQMIVLMQALNKTYFGGAPRVTCFTCHRGSYTPANSPRFSLQYGTPEDEPNVMDFVPDARGSAARILDRYLQALGGEGALATLSSFTARGTYAGFDTGQSEVPVEIFARAPNQRSWTVHLYNGDSHRVYDGRSGWWAGPDSPAPIETLTSGNLDRYRLEALLAFPSGIKQAFSQWKVGRAAIDDRDVQIVQGASGGLLPVNLYFDTATGLLVRLVGWNETPVGPVPTQIEYGDYREVAGVKMPFTWTVSQTYMQMTIKLDEVRPNVPVEASRFAKPAPATPKP